MWGFTQTKGQIPHSTGMYFFQNQVKPPTYCPSWHVVEITIIRRSPHRDLAINE